MQKSFRHMNVKGLGFFQAFQGSYLECSKDPNDPHRGYPLGGELLDVGFFRSVFDQKNELLVSFPLLGGMYG